MAVCTRFRRDGARCTNWTEYFDGWCREGGCDGFLRAEQSGAPESVGVPHGTAKHIRMSQDSPIGDVSVEDVHDIRVTVRAMDSFRYHHGGDERAAEIQLRNMLEDFVLKSAHRPTGSGYLRLSRSGFDIVLSPDRGTITGYSTIHRERTWEQVKSGVKSRFKNGSASTAPRPEAGPPVSMPDFADTFDPASVHLTARVRQSYAQIADAQNGGSPKTSHTELEAAIREAVGKWKSGTVDHLDDGPFEIEINGRYWLTSPDCRVLIGVREQSFKR